MLVYSETRFCPAGQSTEATIHRKIIGTIRPSAFLGDFSGGLSAWLWLYQCQEIGFGYVYGNIVLCVLWPFPGACGQLQDEHADRAVKLRAIRSRTRPYPPASPALRLVSLICPHKQARYVPTFLTI